MTMFGKQMSRAVALAAAGIASLSGIDVDDRPQRGFGFSSTIEGGRYVAHVRDRSRYMPHQGPRECARRQRQMGLV